MTTRLEDYGLIGDCETAALIARDGSIDWLCWPRFDSGACFASLLGTSDHGRWKLAPAVSTTKITRKYQRGTLVLETLFATEEGEVTLIDFMSLRGEHSHIVRLVRGDRGVVRMQMELIIRFDYGRSVPWVNHVADGSLRAIAGPDMLLLRTPVVLTGQNLKTVCDFLVHEGEVIPFVLTYGASHRPIPEPIDAIAALSATIEFWREWNSRSTYKGRWAEAVQRSLITLKALTYMPTGGILAAATTSIPEEPRGPRNWDYRFCWLRDATFTLLALMNAGYYEEASAWQDWLLRAIAGDPAQAQIMYGLAGERQLAEWEVPWLPGYDGSSPVRIGNAAADQLQLDVYGEVSDALHHARKRKLQKDEPSFALQRSLLEYLEKIWREPDEGIWEVRGPRRHFTHSKVMAWVAFDRAITDSEEFGLKGPVDRWRVVRQQIHDDICRNGYDSELGSFVQSYGSKDLDASLLLLSIVGFLPPQDPRIVGTVRAIETHLMPNGFVARYNTLAVEDGLPPGEGAFLACSFWLADNYVLLGRYAEAEHLFTRLLVLQNEVGLLSEEYYPEGARLVGNFPQAFSHVALINTALNLSRVKGPAEQRSE